MNRALAFLCISMILLSGCLGGGEGEWRIRFNGTEMGGQPAPDFTLTNQDGENVSLSDFKGRLVVIAFTYTSCPDVCPMIESNLNVVRENLGDAYGEDVVFISSSIDPIRDTPEKLKTHWIEGRGYDWDHLTHSNLSIISEVWDAYYFWVDEETLESELARLNHEHEDGVSEQWMLDFEDNYTSWVEGDLNNTNIIYRLNSMMEEHHTESGNATDGDCDGYVHPEDNSTDAAVIDLLESHCAAELSDTQLIEAVHNLTVLHTAEGEGYVVGHSSMTLILDADHDMRVNWPGFAWRTDDFTEDLLALLDS